MKSSSSCRLTFMASTETCWPSFISGKLTSDITWKGQYSLRMIPDGSMTRTLLKSTNLNSSFKKFLSKFFPIGCLVNRVYYMHSLSMRDGIILFRRTFISRNVKICRLPQLGIASIKKIN
jgi:hypothetical protein